MLNVNLKMLKQKTLKDDCDQVSDLKRVTHPFAFVLVTHCVKSLNMLVELMKQSPCADRQTLL